MTVTSTSTSITWAGNGSTTEFSYSFLIPAPGQYALYSTTSGVTTQVAQNLYSVSGIGNQGGSVVYPLTGSPVPSGTTLTFVRVVPYQQTFHPPVQGPIYNPQLEGALDNLQMQILQVEQQLGDVSINGTVVNEITFAGSVAVSFRGTEIPGVGETGALITLPPGPTGAQGVRGSVINTGTGAPGTISGALANDLYLDTAVDNIYQFSGTTWALEGSFKGATGTRGSTWYDGAGAPGTVVGAITWDQYLDTNTGNVYQLGTAGSWIKTADIMGPQGLTGATGPQGPVGPTGSGSNILVANNGTLFGTAASEINFTGGTVTESGGTVTVPLGVAQADYALRNPLGTRRLSTGYGTPANVRGKKIPIAASASMTLLNLPPGTGPGVITSFYLGSSCSDVAGRASNIITVTVDGETTPSISATADGLFGGYYGGPFNSKYNGNGGFISAFNGFAGWFRLPIPFNDSIKITLTNASATTTSNIWYYVNYEVGGTYDWGLFGKLLAFDIPDGAMLSVAPYTEGTLLNYSGGPGLWVGGTQFLQSQNGNWAPLEGAMRAYIDGSSAASIWYSGGEDWSNGSFYFGIPITGDLYGCNFVDQSNYRAAYYRWLEDEAIHFNTSFKLTWQNGENDSGTSGVPTVTTNSLISGCQFIYIPA